MRVGSTKWSSKMPKSTKAEVEKRIHEVFTIRLDGAQFHDIVQYAAEHGWNVEERQLWNYIARADKLLVERHEKSRKKLIARHVAQRRVLYARSVNAADYRTALSVLSDEARLMNLYPPTRMETKSETKTVLEIAEEIVDAENPPDDQTTPDASEVPDFS